MCLLIVKTVEAATTTIGTVVMYSQPYGNVSTTAATKTGETGSNKIVIGAIIGIVFALIIVMIVVLWCRQHKKTKFAPYLKPDPNFVIDTEQPLFEQAKELPYPIQWEFPRKFLSFTKMLGSGAFGQQVWLAEAFEIGGFKPRETGMRKSKPKRRSGGITVRYKSHFDTIGMCQGDKKVAVKTLKEDSTQADYIDLASELKILIQVGEHRNIVNLLGACTTSGNLSVILEYCPNGTLLNYLRSRKADFLAEWETIEEKFTFIDLIHVLQQVVKGMEFLKSKKCVHRNLASHNVLVGSDNVMKLSDFGRPRDVTKDNVFLILTQGPNRYVQSTEPLPVKWMAPESVFGKVHTDKSDVWAFGVLLWEVFTLGDQPYPGISNEEMISFLSDERRMTCPHNCPKEIFAIMMECWETLPCNRPTFKQIAERVYNCLKQNGPKYTCDSENDISETPGSSVTHLPAIDRDSTCALYNDGYIQR